MSHLLFRRKIGTPVAVFLSKVIIIFFRDTNSEAFKIRPCSVTILFARSIFKTSLPIAVVAKNVGALSIAASQHPLEPLDIFMYMSVIVK